MSALPGAFGKYFLTEKIATGGMAEIYLAKIIGPGGFEKYLVIKKIHPELSGEQQFVEMFVAEAKTLVSLTHGNIVPIYELGMVDSTYFIAMEYIDGPTLEQLLSSLRESGEKLSPAMTAYICAELMKGLDYAHRKGEGVIHRDLSPRNVMLSREGEVKLVDFGIAVAHVDRGDAQSGVGNPSGSFPYMSPEQARGDSLDGRSDIFASGILLWEMLTGRNLFSRGKDEDTLDAVLHAPIPQASDYCQAAAGVLDVICSKALQRDLSERYSTAGELLVAINRFLYSQDESVTPQDVSRFIAKHCPPTTKEFARPRSRMGTQGDEDAAQSTGARPGRKRSGTVPMERSGTVPMERPQGKRRAETVQSFATHVNLQEVLSHVGDRDEIVDAEDHTSQEPDAPVHTTQESAAIEVQSGDGGDRRSRALLLPIAGAGVLLLGGVFFLGSQMRTNKPLTTYDAAIVAVAEFDAGAPLARADAAVEVLPAPDAAARVKKDASATAVKRRSDAQVKQAPGSIRIGANPWAEVFLDGKSIGRAPGNFEVPAGSHQLELRFHEQSKTMKIDVKSGELTSLGVVDFTGAP